MTQSIEKRDVGFTQINNEILNSTNISLKAKGLYSYMFSKPNGWNFTIKSMATQLKEGDSAISTALKELKEQGVIEYKKYTNGIGEYMLNIGIKTEPKLENPNLGFLIVGKPHRISNKDIPSNKESSNSRVATHVVAHLNKLTSKKYNEKAKETERLIVARLKDGYALEDFINVIDIKVTQWLDDEKMSKYLRPETLFGNKFDKYLNETQEELSVAQRFG